MPSPVPNFLTATNSTNQKLYTILFPYIDVAGYEIANVSKASTAVVTTTESMRNTLPTGTQILITGVKGMTQLKTAGADSSPVYAANVLTDTTFELFQFTDYAGNVFSPVDSSEFSNAVANTGSVNAYTVPQYYAAPSPGIVYFDTTDSSGGGAIALIGGGLISLTGPGAFLLTAVVSCTRTFSSNEAGYQWYDVLTEEAFGPFVKFGQACTATKDVTDSSLVCLRVFSGEADFPVPTELTNATFTVEQIAGI